MTEWSGLISELDRWQAQNLRVRLWWRDDDATEANRQLRAVTRFAATHEVVVALAVIPKPLTLQKARGLLSLEHAQHLVHGFAHINHEGPNRSKREFGHSRSVDDLSSDLSLGLQKCQELLGPSLLPVFVPPWNRIAPKAIQALPKAGYCGLSTWKLRRARHPVPGLLQVNTHVDLIDWRRDAQIKPLGLVQRLLIEKLKRRRLLGLNCEEPLGILTHHVHWCDALETLMAQVMRTTRRHRAVNWLTPRKVFAT